MPEPSWPIFFVDGDDVTVVREPAEVLELDPVFVDDGIRPIDSEGRRLRKVVSGSVRRRWFITVDSREIVGVEVAGDDDSETLRRALCAYLAAVGVTEVDENADIRVFSRAAADHIS